MLQLPQLQMLAPMLPLPLPPLLLRIPLQPKLLSVSVLTERRVKLCRNAMFVKFDFRTSCPSTKLLYNVHIGTWVLPLAGTPVGVVVDRSARAGGPIEPGTQIAPNPITKKKPYVPFYSVLIIKPKNECVVLFPCCTRRFITLLPSFSLCILSTCRLIELCYLYSSPRCG